MKFLLESNLAKLAKWLRFLGHDVKVLRGEINKKELAQNQDRVFITTSKRWVPPKAYDTAYDFTLCPKCNALFWKGTHYEGMVRMLEKALKRC